MSGREENHYRVVRRSVEGKTAVDERTMNSIAVLEERLRRLRKLDRIFNEVKFSAAVRKLMREGDRLLVC